MVGSLPVLPGERLSISTCVKATNSPVEPAKIAVILSDCNVGHSHASIRTAMPEIPNNTISIMPSDLSLIILRLPLKLLLLY